MMEKKYWINRWCENDIGFNQDAPNEHLVKYFPLLDLPTDARVLVPLCGKSVDMIWLFEQGYRIVGVELSEIAAQTFFEENDFAFEHKQVENFQCYYNEKITLYAGDIFSLSKELLGEVAAVYDRGALIALPPAMREKYITHIKHLCDPNTQQLIISLAYAEDPQNMPPFSVLPKEIEDGYIDQFVIKTLSQAWSEPDSKPFFERGIKWRLNSVHHLISK